MTWSMPDSITVPDLPNGYLAYLGYADGDWPTAGALRARFLHAKHVILTVLADGTLDADGCDIETGDLTIQQGADWTRRKLNRDPHSRPDLYASVSRMPGLIAELGTRSIARASVRLHSAHYDWPGGPMHICGPATCRWPGVPPMDGTQWTSIYPGLNGHGVDMSLLEDSFFGLSWTEYAVQQLPEVRQGNTGEAVRTVQGALLARHYTLGQTGPAHNGVDGVFGPVTHDAVANLQMHAGLVQDGVVGPVTWPVLLGIAP